MTLCVQWASYSKMAKLYQVSPTLEIQLNQGLKESLKVQLYKHAA